MKADAFRYDGKRALVVGGATGMGAAVAELVQDLGAEVVVMDYAPVTLEGAKAINLDLRDKAGIDAAIDECGGPIHALFACAGVADGTDGIEKINFVGGEPLCNPLIFDVVAVAHKLGLVVSVPSNGSLLNEGSLDRLAPHVNWIGLSIDSASGVVERRMGRGDGSHVRHCMNVAPLVHELGMQLKVNTTVTKLTFREDMRDLIRALDPQRWKVFQFLHVPGQNDDAVASFAITDEEFAEFKACNDNIKLRNGAAPVFESADLMLDSYLMLTPAGNIFLNREYPFREYALESVTKETLPAILNADNYVKRGAIYAW